MRLIFLLFLIGCGPKPEFITSHGFNVFCNEEVCFSKDAIEIATDILIDELVAKDSNNFSYDKIFSMLKVEREWHSIFVKKAYDGSIGSCPTVNDPNRQCRGFQCGKASPTGWCSGINKTFIYYDVEYHEIWFAKLYDCLASNAYVHEMIHFFQEKMTGFRDYYHEKEPYWSSSCTEEKYPNSTDRTNCIKDTIEVSTNWKICEILCGDLCK